MVISFDRAAEFYDRTRGYPVGVGDAIARALIQAAGVTRESHVLELGVGTGRIALPIIQAGYRYTGLDISPLMLAKLRAALATNPDQAEHVTLVEGDLTALPFDDARFDAVLTVHVYHLVDDRTRALNESLRVLKRPGVLLNGYDHHDDPGETQTPSHPITEQWTAILHGLGWTMERPSEHDVARTLQDDWRRLGGAVDEVAGPTWATMRSPADALDGLEQRLWSRTWAIPDDLHAVAIRQLRAWAEAHYGPRLYEPILRHHRFIIERGRFGP